MNDREKLIELLKDGPSCPYALSPFDDERCNHCRYKDDVYCDISRLADHLIANGATVQKWIPVSERLPDKKGKYLALLEYVKCTMILNFSLDFLVCDEYGFPTKEKKSCFYYYDDDWENIEVPEVTHWMPLPQPPKGE